MHVMIQNTSNLTNGVLAWSDSGFVGYTNFGRPTTLRLSRQCVASEWIPPHHACGLVGTR